MSDTPLTATERPKAEHWTVESYIREEMDARGWTLADLVSQSGLTADRASQFLHLGMWGDDIAPALERAMGVDAQTWTNLWYSDIARELERQSAVATIDALQERIATLEAARDSFQNQAEYERQSRIAAADFPRNRHGYIACGRCGLDCGMDAIIANEHWARIAPEPESGGGMLCLWCMDETLAELGVKDAPVALYFPGRALLSVLYGADSDLLTREDSPWLNERLATLEAENKRLRDALPCSCPMFDDKRGLSFACVVHGKVALEEWTERLSARPTDSPNPLAVTAKADSPAEGATMTEKRTGMVCEDCYFGFHELCPSNRAWWRRGFVAVGFWLTRCACNVNSDLYHAGAARKEGTP